MLAYEIYWLDPIKGYELVGILPERRKNPKRIPEKSIINFGKKLLGDNVNVNNMLFVRRTIDNTTEEIFRLKPSSGVRLEALKANQQ
jgi:hypothetical protein